MNYEEALQFLGDLGKFGLTMQGLKRVERLLGFVGNPHMNLRSAHIAGTNGKGSTAAMIYSVLTTAGHRVGLYTQPHLNSYNERIRIGGREGSHEIPDARVAGILTRMRPYIEEIAMDRDLGPPTEFEVGTAMAFLYFAEEAIDFAVVEVGMGGRFDATNVVRPVVSVITHVDYDHIDKLGRTLEEIAFEKAGIIKQGVPVVVSFQEREAFKVIEKVSREKGAPMLAVGKDIAFEGGPETLEGQRCTVHGVRGDHHDVWIPLLGRHQAVNCATAIGAIEVISESGPNVSPLDIRDGLASVKWPGRMEIVSREPIVILDCAHNPDGMRRLSETMEVLLPGKRLVAVMGISKDKPAIEMVSSLSRVASAIIATKSKESRLGSAEPGSIAEAARSFGKVAHIETDASQAVKKALSMAGHDDVVCICGSIYLIGEVRPFFVNRPLEKEEFEHGKEYLFYADDRSSKGRDARWQVERRKLKKVYL